MKNKNLLPSLVLVQSRLRKEWGADLPAELRKSLADVQRRCSVSAGTSEDLLDDKFSAELATAAPRDLTQEDGSKRSRLLEGAASLWQGS